MDTSGFASGTDIGGVDIIGGDTLGPACIRLMMFSQTDRNYSEITVAISSLAGTCLPDKDNYVHSILTLTVLFKWCTSYFCNYIELHEFQVVVVHGFFSALFVFIWVRVSSGVLFVFLWTSVFYQ